jgi:hypothetical protein
VVQVRVSLVDYPLIEVFESFNAIAQPCVVGAFDILLTPAQDSFVFFLGEEGPLEISYSF